MAKKILLKGIEAEFQSVQTKRNVTAAKKHIINFLGVSQMATPLGLGNFELKLYRLARNGHGKVENLHIFTQHQWEMEVPLLVSEETPSELNGE